MRSLCALLLLSLSFSVHAQTPYLVKDINTTYSHDTHSSQPRQFQSYRNRIYFVATTDDRGTELWSTDGTAGGTSIVADILPGEASSNPGPLGVINDVALFSARDVNHGIEFWTTDGTSAGTRLFHDLNPGPNSTSPTVVLVHNNRLLFLADDGINGRELWSTDGTVAGTRIVKDISPGSASSVLSGFVFVGNELYFTASGRGIWKTDGTEAGTIQVITTSATASSLAVVGSRVFFAGWTQDSGWEPWITDFTEAGTHRIADIYPGSPSSLIGSFVANFVPLGNRVLFTADDSVHGRELWVSDGTAAGTFMLREFRADILGGWPQFGNLHAAVLGGRAYFSAEDDEHGDELWSTDGTVAGTSLFIDVAPGSESSYVEILATMNGKVFFRADDPSVDFTGMFVTDGTVAGTRMLRAADGSLFGRGDGLAQVVDGKLYFAGDTPLTASEPWVTDGTDAGTRMIANIAKDGAPSSAPGLFAATKDLLFFYATEGLLAPSNPHVASLWRSDGTAAGTFKLRETGQSPDPMIGIGPVVLWKDHPSERDWWMSDGTVAGTTYAHTFLRRFGDPIEVEQLVPLGDWFFANVGVYDSTLWRSSATFNAAAVDLGVRDASSLIDVAGKAMFFAGASTRGLWTTDGTAAGTVPTVPDLENAYYGLDRLFNAAGTVFFIKLVNDEKPKLWKSDGTFDGTTVVKELPESGWILATAGRKVFFVVEGEALWVSDGTEAGTIELAKPITISSYDRGPVHTVGDRIVFVQGQSGAKELWASDGTAAGTKKLADFDSYGASVAGAEGKVYFTGSDAARGIEMWTTDGTVEGTRLFYDLNPGPGSSYPASFTKVGDTLFFSAATEDSGNELWALPLTESVLTISDARAQESAGTVRFNVSLVRPVAQPVSIQYATADATAHAGLDYEAASGTLTFAPGETTKTIDVRLLSDTAGETNEMFFVALSNAIGARLLEDEATGIVEDDDAQADLGVTLEDGAEPFDLEPYVRIANAGPRTATNIDVDFTLVPSTPYSQCPSCSYDIFQLANGASEERDVADAWGSRQVYGSAIVQAREADPNPANNAIAWTIAGDNGMFMNAAYLTPNASATVKVQKDSSVVLAPVSSDSTVVAITSEITTGEHLLSFTVTALKVGVALIQVGGYRAPLLVNVVPQGASPRWPDAVEIDHESNANRVDRPLRVTVTPTGTAPLTGAKPTGTVIVSAHGQELARAELAGEPLTIPFNYRYRGSLAYQVDYSGDANFLPTTHLENVYLYPGLVSITGTLTRVAAGSYRLNVRVAGTPGLPPTSDIEILHNGMSRGLAPLTPLPNGTAVGETTITGLPESPTIEVHYLGDDIYQSAAQEIRLPESRTRGARH